MSYTVLARKYRSRDFDEVVGQGPIVQTLRNAIATNRVHHGYLFCGTRGVGKTSMARILAKCLNCLKVDAPTTEPCGKCDSCIAVARGEDVDVIEIDAASNTGVDDVRELRGNAIFRPARARFKIYIIDEVHMLSTQAFNALLKTLEEPPGHVKFIFATTEVQKVPATIQSRVQRFDFKSIPAVDIGEQLASICKKESVKAEPAALKRIARLANGSMRDALSLLDQIISMGGASVTAALVDELLPATHDELLAVLIDRIAESDASGALAAVDRSLGQGHNLDQWCTLLIGQLRDLMMLRVCGAETDLIDVPAALRTALVEQSHKIDSGSYIYMITLLEELRRGVKYSGCGRALVEAAVVRMADASKFSSIESLIAQLGSGASGAAPGTGTAATGRPASAPRAAIPPPRGAMAPQGPSVAKKKELSFSDGAPVDVLLDARLDAIPATAPGLPQPRAIQPDITAPRTTEPSTIPSSPAADSGSQVGRPSLAPATSRSTPAKRASPPEPVGAPRRVTQADLRAAHAEPMVKAALDIFNGRIVDVVQAVARKSEVVTGDVKEVSPTETQS